ncbi:MAG: Xaa-Pro peptidase family protein [Actinomycetes bacterium]
MSGHSIVSSSGNDEKIFADRLERARQAMRAQGVDVALLSLGLDMPYLTGYNAMPLERLTMLVLPASGDAVMVIPRLEAPRVQPMPNVFSLLPWNETDDPVAITAELVRSAAPSSRVVAVGDQMWARFLVDLMPLLPHTQYRRSVDVIGSLRMRKDSAEIEALRSAGSAVDIIAGDLQAGRIALVGRTEAQVSADLSARIIAQGHDVVNFAIVAAGENAASPHHHPGSRVIQPNEIVLCDFGGTMNGYCSDITRCVYTGEPSSEVAEAYAVLFEAEAAAVRAATVGTPCEEVDAVARRVITAAGFGEYFIHRTGHGIGLDAHEDPYIVSGNSLALEAGHAFSIEPGIYMPGKWGMRLEDIVVATIDGPDSMNHADHHLWSV